MKKNTIKSAAFILGATLVLSGCGGSGSNSTAQTDPLELESDGKTLVFYSALTNEHYGFEVDSQKVINLQESTDANGHDVSNFNMNESDSGKLFLWIDNKGTEDRSDDEDKIIMFKQDYSFKKDGNATWEDFYYLGHFHGETTKDNQTNYHLAAHVNDEFKVSSGAKYNAMMRLNQYLAAQNTLEEQLLEILPEEANGLCGFHTFISKKAETFYYAMGKNGTMYIYDERMRTELDSVVVTDSCKSNEFGMSSTEDGVLYYSADTQELYSVDSHDDGIHHVHSYWGVSQLIGNGNSAEMMVGLAPLID